MRKLKIVFREIALSDLDEIWLYTLQTWSKDQADKYHGLIYRKVVSLTMNPDSGKKQDHIRRGY